jgi:hypothetical protein
MPAPIPPGDVHRALQALNISPNELEAIRRSPFPQAQELLKRLKDKAKRAFRKLAPELHPDRNEGDEAKTELFKLLSRVVDEIDKIKIAPMPPPQVVRSVQYVVRRPASSATGAGWHQIHVTSTNSGTTNTGFTPEQVIRIVKMRPK